MENLLLSVTNRCNSRCIMCNIWKSGKPKDIAAPAFEKIAAANRGSYRTVTITGGEPTVVPENVIKAIEALSPRLAGLTSNGYNTKKLVALTDELSGLTRLSVSMSLDGDRPTHDAVRGVQCYDKVLESARTLVAAGYPVNLRMTLLPQNYDKMLDVWATTQDVGANFSCGIFIDDGVYHKSDAGLNLDGAQRKEALRQLREINESYRNLYINAVIGFLEGRRIGCTAGTDTIYMDENLDVYACTGLAMPFGNLSKFGYSIPNTLASNPGVMKSVRNCAKCVNECTFRCGIAKKILHKISDGLVFS